jgi:hypothetical protein
MPQQVARILYLFEFEEDDLSLVKYAHVQLFVMGKFEFFSLLFSVIALQDFVTYSISPVAKDSLTSCLLVFTYFVEEFCLSRGPFCTVDSAWGLTKKISHA